MRLGGLDIKSNYLLAPIAGFSDVGFRQVCAKCGAGITFTEMVSAKGLVYGSDKTEELLHTSESESIKAVQIFGSDPEFIRKAVCLEALEKFELIDINMGCPVPKIVKNGDGSALLNDLGRAKEVMLAAKEKGAPVSVKARLGFNDGDFNTIKLAKIAKESGVSFITVHGRTRSQFYSGKSDWDKIAQIVKEVDIDVVANGDIVDIATANSILEQTKAKAFMIARGALGNPFIFTKLAIEHNLKDAIDDDFDYSTVKVAMEHFQTLMKHNGERYALLNFKKQLPYYVKRKRNSKDLKIKAFLAKTVQEMTDVINSIGE